MLYFISYGTTILVRACYKQEHISPRQHGLLINLLYVHVHLSQVVPETISQSSYTFTSTIGTLTQEIPLPFHNLSKLSEQQLTVFTQTQHMWSFFHCFCSLVKIMLCREWTLPFQITVSHKNTNNKYNNRNDQQYVQNRI